MKNLRYDIALSFIAGIASMAALAYFFWRAAGQPPSQP